jgi:hypothetical protein
VLGIVQALLVVIWLASGGGYFWPVWPLAGLATAAALDALATFGRRPTQSG